MRANESRRQRDEKPKQSADAVPAGVERPTVLDDTNDPILVGDPTLASLDTLPSDEKQAIETTYYGRCSYREAAVTLGESEATVKLRIRSGLRRLAALNGSFGGPPALAISDEP